MRILPILALANALAGAASVVTLTVRDPQGQPLASARVEQKNSAIRTTDARGKLAFSPSEPFIVRKPGYRSIRVRNPASQLHVVLVPIGFTQLPRCPARFECAPGPYMRGRLCVPLEPGVILGPFEPSIDTTNRRFTLVTAAGEHHLRHDMGLVSLPDPTLAHLAEMDQLEERTFWVSASQIFQPGFAWDVKTTAPSRLISRLILANFEQLSYTTSDPSVAAVFDRMLDRICVREELPK